MAPAGGGLIGDGSALTAICDSEDEPKMSEMPCFARLTFAGFTTGSSDDLFRLSSSEDTPDEELLDKSSLIPASCENSSMMRSKNSLYIFKIYFLIISDSS